MPLGRTNAVFPLCKKANQEESLAVNTSVSATKKSLSRSQVQNCSAGILILSEYRILGPFLRGKDQQWMSSHLASREEPLPRKIANMRFYPAEIWTIACFPQEFFSYQEVKQIMIRPFYKASCSGLTLRKQFKAHRAKENEWKETQQCSLLLWYTPTPRTDWVHMTGYIYPLSQTIPVRLISLGQQTGNLEEGR